MKILAQPANLPTGETEYLQIPHNSGVKNKYTDYLQVSLIDQMSII